MRHTGSEYKLTAGDWYNTLTVTHHGTKDTSDDNSEYLSQQTATTNRLMMEQ